MEIASKYEPKAVEEKWYKHWNDKGYFRSVPDAREPYCIVIPPPNVTGVLHMGHILNNTLQDVLVRRARMLGKNACWVPGTDHASIATEAKVVGKLRDEGIKKSDITRDEFLQHAWQWKEKHGGIILEQLKKMGACCDWERTKFTMDQDLSESVIKVFVDMFNKGLIYRGVRMVNWDPKALTAVSDEEVIHKEVRSKLYYVRYLIEGTTDEWITIATTRPETILGDTAICVHPEDARYTAMKGKRILVPLINRSVPLIMDEYVDREFGTGALKVTPAHDINDYNLGIKHKLETVDIFNENGTLNEKAQLLVGVDRFKARKQIVQLLEEAGQIVKIEELTNSIGYSERTDEVIEPRLSLQWFLKMENLAKPALDVVMNDTVQFHPAKFKNTYRHWMENVRDWCISRQLWWGHRIPAWYLPGGDFVVAENETLALEVARKQSGNAALQLSDLHQDEDVLDTWFSSWLWPISVFDGIRHPDNADIKYYYPTDDLITAPEILFFWVARMIMAGLEYAGGIPFKNVYLTGIVRDKQGRKMSKQLGNSPDPLDMIAQYGADGVRTGMLFCSPAGNDLPFDISLIEQGRNFCNKIWNAFRLVKGWNVDDTLAQPDHCAVSVAWYEARMNEVIEVLNDHFSKYRISDALMAVYKLVWDDYCSWYLEMIKPVFGQPIDRKTYDATIVIFEKLLKLLHPFTPFITEELYHALDERKESDCIINASWPAAGAMDESLTTRFDYAREVIMGIRNARKEHNISPKDPIKLFVRKNDEAADPTFDNVAKHLCNLEELSYVESKPEGTANFIIRSTEFYIPVEAKIDDASSILKLKEELNYTKGFLVSVSKKLENEKFVNNAKPEVVDIERKKKADAEARIRVIEEQLSVIEK
ncbi:MAG: valine--tRNA ligase [Bacteroidota bacterium]